MKSTRTRNSREQGKFEVHWVEKQERGDGAANVKLQLILTTGIFPEIFFVISKKKTGANVSTVHDIIEIKYWSGEQKEISKQVIKWSMLSPPNSNDEIENYRIRTGLFQKWQST